MARTPSLWFLLQREAEHACTPNVCQKLWPKTSSATRHTTRHMPLLSSSHVNRNVSLSYPQTRTCDAWETLHAAGAPSPNAFAVEKHASAAAATQMRLYITIHNLGKIIDERALLPFNSVVLCVGCDLESSRE